MNRDDIQKLLGGYATGTLTPEEQEALFDAALSDQELFDALAREQALRDLLRDPVSKAQLLAALEEPPTRWYDKLFGAWRPIAMGMAMAAVTTVAVVAVWQNRKPQPIIVSMATTRPTASPLAVQPLSEDKAAAVRDDAAPKSQPAEADSAKRAANEAPAKAIDRPQSLADESRRAKSGAPAVEEKSKDLAGAVGGARPTFGDQVAPATPPPARFDRNSPVQKEEQVPLPLTPVPSPPQLALGFREGARPAGGGGRGGRGPQSDAKLRAEVGSANGGVIGGIVGGAPGAAPPPPVAAPKAEAAPSQIAKSATAQAQPEPLAKQSQSTSQQIAGYPSQQGQQGAQQQTQSGQQSLGQVDQLRQARLQTPAQETVQGTASASSVEARSDRDARSLYYGSAAPAANKPALDAASASTATGAVTRKKVAEAPQTKSLPAPKTSMIAASVRPGTLQPRNPGVRYSLLRKTASGELEAIDPKSARPGDTLELQLTPNHPGVLTVSARSESGDSRVLLIRNVEAMQVYATPTLLATDQELRVTLIPTSARADNLKRDENAAAEFAQQSTTERATYVVGSPASPKVEFTITLNHK